MHCIYIYIYTYIYIHCLVIKRSNGQFWINNGGFWPGFSMEHGGFSRRATFANQLLGIGPLVTGSPCLQELNYFLKNQRKQCIELEYTRTNRLDPFRTHCFNFLSFFLVKFLSNRPSKIAGLRPT